MGRPLPSGDSEDSCGICGHPLGGKDRCEMCGAPAVPRIARSVTLKCPLCGGELDGSLNCPKCGKMFGREAETPEPGFQCPRCAKQVAVNDVSCGGCGLHIWIDESAEKDMLDSLKCPACGTTLGREDQKCGRCGFLVWFESEEETREKAERAIDEAATQITRVEEKTGKSPERAVAYLEGAKRGLEAGETDIARRRALIASDIAETTVRQAEILKEALRRAETKMQSAEAGGADITECRGLLVLAREATDKGEHKVGLRLALKCKILAENLENSMRRAPIGA